jgi:tetratricopeptide (TPR) repeat protein
VDLSEVLRHKGEPRTPYYVEIPTALGKLRLDLLGEVGAALVQAGSTEEEQEATEKAIGAARARLATGDGEGAKELLLDAVKEHPYAANVYGMLYDVYTAEGNLQEAEFCMKQAIALGPDFRNLSFLARNLGRQGRLEEAATLQEYLWQTRSEAPPEQALDAIHDYLVTLGRLQQPQTMMDVSMRAMQEHGSETTLVYQYIFALVLSNQQDAAREHLRRVLPQLDVDDPLYPRFVQMRDFLGGATHLPAEG